VPSAGRNVYKYENERFIRLEELFMYAKKHIILVFGILLLLVIAILNSCKEEIYMLPTKQSLDFSELIGNENTDDINLTIYYMSPYILTNTPLSIDNFINSYQVNRNIIKGRDLEGHIDLFKQISNDDLVPVKKKSSFLNVRLYYVFESKKNGKLFDVAMWGGDGDDNSIFVSGFEVQENEIFYDVIMPFLPEDAAKEWSLFINELNAVEDSKP